jgi:serine/threonine protein kinase
MLCGYLPFDDDPANPEGDNINLLYKYIMESTLEFPSYVSQQARSLVSRILIPDPKKRATMAEIQNHM